MSVPVSRDRLGTVTAYSYAVAGGYTGTEAEFQELLGNVAIDLSEIENLSVIVTPLSEGSTPTASYDSGVLTLGIPKGDTGDSGVYIGETAPTNPNVDVWINPNGEGIEMVQDVTVGGNSVVTDGVAEIPVASDTQLGIVQTNPSAGIDINPSTNKLRINNANSSMVRLGTESYRPITPSNQDASTFYGLAKASGDTTQSQSNNPVGTYTNEAKTSIQSMLGVPSEDDVVTDVQVNGISVVTDGVANVPVASASAFGVVKTSSMYGIQTLTNGTLDIVNATGSEIKAGENANKPIVPEHQHESAFYGLAKAAGDTTQSASSNAVGTYTPEAKIAIKQMLGIADSYDCFIEEVTGTDPVIVGEPSYRYNCGTVDTLTITPPASGTIDVIFSSGSTPTVLTLPQTVRMPDWWVDVEANTTYEMCITDGAYCGVMSWAD